MTAIHARLGPSGAHRWMPCPGSIVLEAPYPNNGSVFADEGTAAHELAAACLMGNRAAHSFLGEKITVNDRVFIVDKVMADFVQDYVKLVRQEAIGGQLLVEQRVPIGHITGEEGAGGTADAVILNVADRTIKIIDLKYGMGVKVDALDNPQLMMYALGGFDQYSMLGDFDSVSMLIHQPRLNHVAEFHVPVSQLEDFRAEVKVAAARVHDATTAKQHDKPTPAWSEEYLQPGPKQCRFCRAKPSCPALRAEVADTVGRATLADFAGMVPVTVNTETEEDYLATAMDKVALVEGWCKAIRDETERRLLSGGTVAGYKVVQGRRGNMQWSDDLAVAKLLKSYRLRAEEMFERKLISPTKARKLLENNPRRWAKLEQLTNRAMGKPSVVHTTDKRSEMTVNTVAEDFRALVKTAN